MKPELKMGDIANVEPAADEIEVTPEMIEAGMRELELSFDTDGGMDPAADVVSDVFRAMWRAARVN